MWWVFLLMGVGLCVRMTILLIIAATKAETGETWAECTKRFMKGFLGKD